MKSIGQKIQQIAGLVDTADVSVWENGFITRIVKITANGAETTALTPRQVETIENIYERNFA